MFVPQSLSNAQANRVPVVCCGFSCSSLLWFTSTPKPPNAPRRPPSARWAPAAGVQGASHLLPLPGGGSSLTGRCAVRPVGVAARRRAPTAVNNGAGREEKGNLLGEAVRPAGGQASERASEQAREERVHFCPGVSETRPPQARAKKHRGSGSASSEKPGEGSQRWDRSAPPGRGAREPGQRGKPRGARPGRAPGAAQDAARRAAVAATAPLRL